MNKILEALKKFFSKNTLITIKNFIVKYRRYFLAGLLLAAAVLLLVFCTYKGKDGKKGSTAEETESTEALSNLEVFVIDTEYAQDQDADLNALITTYFTAYANDDTATLDTVAYPISENEASYIAMLSQYIESFDGISCYTMHGLEEGSYLVSAYAKIKFAGVETEAPTLEFFYVKTDANGTYYIDNTYSSYNYSHQDNALDNDIVSVISQFQSQEVVVNLRAQVQTEYNEALASDTVLSDMLTSTVPSAIRVWAESVNTTADTQVEETPAEDTQADTAAEDTAAEDAAAEDTGDAAEAQEETTVTVQVKVESVNIRDIAGTDGNVLGKAASGDTFTKVGEDGDWTIIDYNGTNAYIKTELLEVI